MLRPLFLFRLGPFALGRCLDYKGAAPPKSSYFIPLSRPVCFGSRNTYYAYHCLQKGITFSSLVPKHPARLVWFLCILLCSRTTDTKKPPRAILFATYPGVCKTPVHARIYAGLQGPIKAALRFRPFPGPLLRFLPRMCFYIPPVLKIELRAISAGRFSACRRSGTAAPVKDSKAGAAALLVAAPRF